jgi:sugar/nucleoside kinase (ribokinase family)
MRYTKTIPKWGTEIFFDESEDRIGGQCANFAIAISKLGRETAIVGNLGSDPSSESIFSDLCSLPHLDCRFLTRDKSVTGYTVSIVRTDGERSFFSYLGHQTKFSITKYKTRLVQSISKKDIVHISGFFMIPNARKEISDFVREIKQDKEAIISFDPGWDPSDFDHDARNDVFAILKYADYFEPNEVELLTLSRSKSIRKSILEIQKRFGGVLALKRGRKGSLIVRDSETIAVPAFQTNVRDSTGAGDTFDAGFLSSISRGGSLKESGRFGNAVAALTISRSGDPPRRFPSARETLRLLARS